MKLLLPPGIGDLHWIMLKMRPWLSLNTAIGEADVPEVFICSTDPAKDRAHDYIKSLPFVRFGGYVDVRADRKTFVEVFQGGKWKRNYRAPDGRVFDHYFGVNKEVQLGMKPAAWWPETMGTEVDYDYPIEVSDSVPGWCLARPFVLCAFYRHGWYQDWTRDLPPFRVIAQIREVLPDHEIVITGAKWDKPLADAIAQRNKCRSIAGQTKVDELLTLMKGATAWIGHIAGNAMLAQHLDCATVALWGESQFKKSMWNCWVSPNAFYRAVDVKERGGAVIKALEDVIVLKSAVWESF